LPSYYVFLPLSLPSVLHPSVRLPHTTPLKANLFLFFIPKIGFPGAFSAVSPLFCRPIPPCPNTENPICNLPPRFLTAWMFFPGTLGFFVLLVPVFLHRPNIPSLFCPLNAKHGFPDAFLNVWPNLGTPLICPTLSYLGCAPRVFSHTFVFGCKHSSVINMFATMSWAA